MKIIDILQKLDERTKIKVYTNGDEIGVLHLSPYRSSLMKKYDYEIEKMLIRNNILCIYATQNQSGKDR